MTTTVQIGFRIRETRLRAGLSQDQLAAAMGTSQSAIARLELGKSSPSLTTLRRIAAATGTRVLITFEAEDKESP